MLPVLDTLSSLLSQQHDTLPYGAHVSTMQFPIKVDDVFINVKVEMERIKNWAPKTEVVYRGKLFTDIAKIEINPSNGKVFRVVSEHFKNQESLFSNVFINDRQLTTYKDLS